MVVRLPGQKGNPKWQDRDRHAPEKWNALSSEPSATPKISQDAMPREQLARVRPSVAGAWQLDAVGHARSRRGLAGTRDGEARSVPVLFRCGHRDRADAAPRVWSTVAANRRTAALDRHPTRGES